jgi:putative transposase
MSAEKTHQRIVRELDPNNEVLTSFRKYAGTKRLVYNLYLEAAQTLFHSCQDKVRFLKKNDFKREFTARRHSDFPWMDEIPSNLIELAIDDADRAYQNFYAARKKARKVGLPRRKKKGNARDSFRFRNELVKLLDRRHIHVSKIGRVRLKEPLRFIKDQRVVSLTVYREADRWFGSFLVEEPLATPVPPTNPIVGVDLGVLTFATVSDGFSYQRVAHTNALKSSLKRLQRLSRQQSRKERGSNSKKKATMKLARQHRRVKNIRETQIHKLTTKLAKTKSVVVIEDLNVSGMVKNKNLARSVMDQGFGMVRRQLEYKTKKFGSRLLVVDRFFPSSKLCSVCGFKCEKMPLSVRRWSCVKCGATHDRDENASENLRQEGQRMLANDLVPQMLGEFTPEEIPLGVDGTMMGCTGSTPEASTAHGSLNQEAGSTCGKSSRTVSPVNAGGSPLVGEPTG